MNIVLVDLGMGNLRSVERALVRAGAHPKRTQRAEDIASAEALILPGQGAFAGAARALQSPVGAALRDALQRGVPYFGICLGMQVLFERSEESPEHAGLGIVKGDVRRLRPVDHQLKVPHMGWNQVHSRAPLVADGDWFYFVHSYHCIPDDKSVTVATADYGEELCAALQLGSIFACQFHPEKSQEAGERLFTRFLDGLRAK